MTSANRRAWLDLIRKAEGTLGEDGYGTTFGYKFKHDTSKPHPGVINKTSRYSSDATGAYQFLSTTWKDVWGGENRPMTPENQDEAAARLMRRRGVDPDSAFSRESLAKLAPEWASLPKMDGNSYYGQPVKGADELEAFFGERLALHQQGGGAGAPKPPAPAMPAAGGALKPSAPGSDDSSMALLAVAQQLDARPSLSSMVMGMVDLGRPNAPQQLLPPALRKAGDNRMFEILRGLFA